MFVNIFPANSKRYSFRDNFLSFSFCFLHRIFDAAEFLTFHLLHAREFSLPEIVEWMGGRRLEIHPVLSHAGARCVTACTHT